MRAADDLQVALHEAGLRPLAPRMLNFALACELPPFDGDNPRPESLPAAIGVGKEYDRSKYKRGKRRRSPSEPSESDAEEV